MTKGTWFVIMYTKNLILFCILVLLTLSLFDATRSELDQMILSYESLVPSMKVIFITGLAAVPLVLTMFESRLVDSVIKRGRNEQD